MVARAQSLRIPLRRRLSPCGFYRGRTVDCGIRIGRLVGDDGLIDGNWCVGLGLWRRPECVARGHRC